MNEKIANKSAESENTDIISFVNDFLHRLKRMWVLVLVLTVVFSAIFYYRTM